MLKEQEFLWNKYGSIIDIKRTLLIYTCFSKIIDFSPINFNIYNDFPWTEISLPLWIIVNHNSGNLFAFINVYNLKREELAC